MLMVNTGKELIQINTSKNTIEYSTTQGRTWIPCFTGTSCGTFKDLLLFDGGLIAATSKGIYFSSNGGRSWIPRFTSNGYGDLHSFPENGKELLATTTKGLCTFINSADVGLKDDKKGNVEAQEVGENYNIYDKKTEV